MKHVDPSTLRDANPEKSNQTILDVLPDDVFEKRHIENALNACIYEIDFLEKAEALIPEKSQEIVVYGQNDQYEAAPLAFEKLKTNGWTNVSVLKGGFENWEQHGYPIEGSGENPRSLSGTFEANAEESVVRWIGRNLLNQHNGVVGLEKAILKLDQDELIGGEAIIDMTRMDCQDIEDPSMAQMLIGHLRTEDFFLVDEYPTARFVVSTTEKIHGSHPGSPNYNIEGTFTLRGCTQKVSFPATLGKNDGVLALQASFEIDRVLWNSKYGSGKIYEALGKHVVNDLISISFQLIAPIR